MSPIERVADEPGGTVDRLHDLAIGMDPEDGVIRVHGGDEEVLAFRFGVENLRERIAMNHKAES